MKERRRAPRFVAIFAIKYDSSGIVSFHSKTTSINVSKVGLKLPLYRLFRPGAKLRLEMDVPGFRNPIKATGEIVWTRKSDNKTPGIVDAGVKFVSIKDEDISKVMEIAKKGPPA